VGDIDEVALFTNTLNAAQIHQLYATGRALTPCRYSQAVMAMNPLAYWRFENNAVNINTSTNDFVYDATIGGSPQAMEGPTAGEGAFGVTNRALLTTNNINGATAPDYLCFPTTGFPTGTNAVSITAWVYGPTTLAGGMRVFFQYGALLLDAVDTKLYADAYAQGRVPGNTVLNDGQWHFVALTVQGTTPGNVLWKLYADGQLDNSVTMNSNLYDPSVGWICRFSGAEVDPWPGGIDEVAVFARTLSDAEILQLFTMRPKGTVMMIR
jgi:hypothetical protein